MVEKRITVWVQRFKDRPHLVLQWTDPESGRRKSRSAGTGDAKEAEDARSDLEYELTHGKYQEASRMTWERFRELFEAEVIAGVRENTRRNYATTLDLFEQLCHPAKLRTINERTISGFLAGLRKLPGRAIGSDGMMASTIKVRLQFLHTALAWAVEQKMLPAIPKFPAVKVPKKAPQPVPAEAFEKLLEKAADLETKAYLLCGWLAGMRLSEALALEWEETEKAPYVDLTRSRIILPAEFTKAVKDQWVPLDRDLRLALLALPRHGRKVFQFLDRLGRPLGACGVSQQVIALAKRAGVRLTMKSLRKGFGCRYAGKVSAHVLQQLMRHANIKTTLDYYVNIDQAVEEAVLGPQRNSLRNNGAEAHTANDAVGDVTAVPGGTNSPSAN